jgi:hypothetical protein
MEQLLRMLLNKLHVLVLAHWDGPLLEVLCLLHVKLHQITIYTLMIEHVELI